MNSYSFLVLMLYTLKALLLKKTQGIQAAEDRKNITAVQAINTSVPAPVLAVSLTRSISERITAVPPSHHTNKKT